MSRLAPDPARRGGVPPLAVERLRAGYDGAAIVREASFEIDAGEAVAITGANGSGKTTLCRALVGLAPASGAVRLGGEPVLGLPAEEVARRGLVLVPQDRGTFAGLSVAENLALGANRRRRAERRTAVGEALAWFPQLKARLAQPAGVLSGGEQRLLALARAMLMRPRVMVLDEPTAGLNPVTAQEVAALLRRIRAASGLPLLLIEHDATVVRTLADRVLRLADGVLTPAA